MTGKVALVTGGSRGIGLATARALAARGAGGPVPAPTAHRGQLAGNVLTLDWTLDANGYTEEENKVINETRKILQALAAKRGGLQCCTFDIMRADDQRSSTVGSQFDFIENVFWLRDGSFLIAYQTPTESTADERRRHLLGVSRDGRLQFETRDGPRLLNAEAKSSALYFVDPGAEVPNQWAVARLRR